MLRKHFRCFSQPYFALYGIYFIGRLHNMGQMRKKVAGKRSAKINGVYLGITITRGIFLLRKQHTLYTSEYLAF